VDDLAFEEVKMKDKMIEEIDKKIKDQDTILEAVNNLTKIFISWNINWKIQEN
jgi:hypothetical protein